MFTQLGRGARSSYGPSVVVAFIHRRGRTPSFPMTKPNKRAPARRKDSSMKRTLLASAAMAALVTSPAIAEDTYDLDEITIYSNESVTELKRSGTTTEVLVEAEIEKAPETKLADTFARLPGVTVSANGGPGTSTTLRIRGLGAGYVPVYFDGIDVSDPASSGNGFDWGGMTGTGLSRVEILKGSQSARYGATAVGGVVNLESFRPTKDGFSGVAGTELGTYNSKRANIGLGYMDERTEIAFSLSRFDTDGFSARSAGTEDDGYSETRASLFFAYDLTDTARVGFNLLAIDSEGEFDEFTGDGALPYDEVNTRETFGGRVFAEFTTGAVAHSLSYAVFDSARVSYSNGTPTPFNGRRQTAEYTAAFNTGATTDWTAGLTHTKETANGFTATTNSAFVELAYAPTEALDITATLRYDDLSNFDNKVTGRLALAYQLGGDMTLRAQAATGYKPPTLYQLTSVYGRPDLLPEESTTFEIGLEKRFGDRGFARATAFYNDIKNNIVYSGAYIGTCASAWGCYGQTDLKTKGVELSGEYALNDIWTITGAYTYTHAVRSTGRAGRVPKHDLNIGVDAAFANGLNAFASVNYLADRVDRDDATVALPNYALVNAGLSYDLNDSAAVYLRIENLLDKDYETAGGYGTPGRSLYFGVRASF